MNTAVLKTQVMAYWRAKPENRPIKVVSLLHGPATSLRGYITCYKFVAGRPLAEVEKILGLKPDALAAGAYVYELMRMPQAHEFELRGYSQCPDGKNWTADSDYPAGQGAAQWQLIVEIPARLVATIPRNGLLKSAG